MPARSAVSTSTVCSTDAEDLRRGLLHNSQTNGGLHSPGTPGTPSAMSVNSEAGSLDKVDEHYRGLRVAGMDCAVFEVGVGSVQQQLAAFQVLQKVRLGAAAP